MATKTLKDCLLSGGLKGVKFVKTFNHGSFKLETPYRVLDVVNKDGKLFLLVDSLEHWEKTFYYDIVEHLEDEAEEKKKWY